MIAFGIVTGIKLAILATAFKYWLNHTVHKSVNSGVQTLTIINTDQLLHKMIMIRNYISVLAITVSVSAVICCFAIVIELRSVKPKISHVLIVSYFAVELCLVWIFNVFDIK